MNRFCLLVLASLTVCSLRAERVPFAFAFQGRLTLSSYGSEGATVEGTHTLRVSLHELPSGGTTLWERTYEGVKVDARGNFSVTLEDSAEEPPVTTLREVIALGKPLYVELAVDGGEGLSPRVRLADVPRVVRATWADASDGTNDFDAAAGVTAKALVPDDEFAPGRLSVEAKQLSVEGNVRVKGTLRLTGRLGASGVDGFGQVPVGTIVAYAGESEDLPEGWAVCDGTEGTPDLTHRFIMGAGSGVNANSRGGSDAVTLTAAHLPPHAHTVSLPLPGDMRGNPNGWRDHGKGGNYWNRMSWSETRETSSAGGGKAHNNLPPYRTLRFIMRVR